MESKVEEMLSPTFSICLLKFVSVLSFVIVHFPRFLKSVMTRRVMTRRTGGALRERKCAWRSGLGTAAAEGQAHGFLGPF